MSDLNAHSMPADDIEDDGDRRLQEIIARDYARPTVLAVQFMIDTGANYTCVTFPLSSDDA